MRRTSVVRFLTSLVITSFVLAGPLAPLAGAQQPAESAQVPAAPMQSAQAQPAPPVPAQPMPPTQPAQPAQPDLFQETLKAQRTSDRAQGLYTAEAAVTNVFLVPGRAITCAAGAIAGVGILALSFGTGYRAAGNLFNEGCGGKWIVKGDDMRPDTPSTLFYSDSGR